MIQNNRSIHPMQMEAWICKLQANMRDFLNKENVSDEEKIVFIRNQYALLQTVTNVLNGKSYFLGCSHSLT